MGASPLSITRECIDNVVVLRLRGELSSEGHEPLVRAADAEMAHGRLNIVLDASELEFISSRGFGAMIKLHHHVRRRFGRLRVAALNQRIAPMARLLRLDKLLTIDRTVDDAITAFQKDVWM